MSKKKVLFVTQEMQPYTDSNDISEIARALPPYSQDQGMEVRVLMPRFGVINERRHRLHEVVRLSGMNIIVDDDDYPLIIKVASLPGARMQVYFLDNDDFFRRKQMFTDDDQSPYDDNADRMVFFCKGVLETVKKFGWSPDIVHCHGWMTSLIPLYLKTAYKNEPLFRHSKAIYSIYPDPLDLSIPGSFLSKAGMNHVGDKDLAPYLPDSIANLHQGAMHYADAVALGSETLPEGVPQLLAAYDKPILPYKGSSDEAMTAFMEFYQALFKEEVQG